MSALILLATLAAAAPEGVRFQHLDWELACDNTGACRAAGYQADADERLVSVLLTRYAGPVQPVSAELLIGVDEDTLVASRRVTLYVDGTPAGEVDVRIGSATLPPEMVHALLEALRRDSNIEFRDAGGRWHLSDDGAVAVLLKMDEVQRRVGTFGALIRRGDRGEKGVPVGKRKPVIARAALWPTTEADAALAADPAFVRAMSAATRRDECDPSGFLEPGTPVEFEVQRLDAHRVLATTVCWRAAYNAGSGYWVVDAAPPHKAKLVTTDATGAEAGEITSWQKGRGLGDCISQSTWVWDGTAFRLSRAQSSGLCKGFPGGAWELPTFVSEVRTPATP
jgi:hypothetical protein